MWIADPSNPLVDLAGLLLVAGLLLLQLRRRRVSIRRLWLTPAVLVAVTAWSLFQHAPAQVTGWVWLVAALLIGGVMGGVRGALVDVHRVDPTTGELLVQNTGLGVIIWLVAFAARIVVRQVVGHTQADSSALGVAMTALLLAALGGVVARSISLYFSYQNVKRSVAW
jgi:hypothetical protein